MFLLYSCLSKLHRAFKQHKTRTKNTTEPPRYFDREITAANKKRTRSRGIRRPIVPKLEENPKNLRAVVGRQLIELLDDVQHHPLDRPRHPRNTPTIYDLKVCTLQRPVVVRKRVFRRETSRVTVSRHVAASHLARLARQPPFHTRMSNSVSLLSAYVINMPLFSADPAMADGKQSSYNLWNKGCKK